MTTFFRSAQNVSGIGKTSIACAALVACAVSGCSSSSTPDIAPKTYKVAFRQVPPQPVYNRVSFVPLPEPMPSRELPASTAGRISPMVHLDLKNATLEEASSVLAAVSRYSSFTSSSIAKQRITLNMLGTIEELGERISNEAGIKVVIDHDTRQVRFLTGLVEESASEEGAADAPEAPRFLESD